MPDFSFPPLAERQAQIVNSRRRFLLASGPKLCGKTVGCTVAVAKHLHDVDRANAAVVVHRVEAAKRGVWNDLTEFTIEGQFQTRCRAIPYVESPRLSNDTRQNYFTVRNGHGGISRCTLYSLASPRAAERMFRMTRFTMIYLNEADLLLDDGLFRTLAAQLRAINVPFEQHRMVIDCNPPEFPERHWLYPLFIDQSGMKEEYRSQFETVYFGLDDNPWLSDEQRNDLVEGYRADPSKYARFVEGRWVRSSSGSLFERVFSEARNVIGGATGGTSLALHDDSLALVAGWDLGDVNNAFALMGMRMVTPLQPAFDIIDELVTVKTRVPLEKFIRHAVDKVRYWMGFHRDRTGREIESRHWSDTSSLVYNAAAGTTEAKMIERISNGQIRIRPVVKGAGSVNDRVMALFGLLKDRNLMVSSRCPAAVEMLMSIRASEATRKTTLASMLSDSDPQKHIFDAVSYPIASEIPRHMVRPEQGIRRQPSAAERLLHAKW